MGGRNVEFVFRPIERWNGQQRTPRRSQFKVTPGRTQDDLRYELAKINVRSCVLQADLSESDIRIDGMPRANARYRSARVILSFTHPKQGEISFPCGTYTHFWCNVRAIVKTLESLRAVDRYGVTQKSEQYTGWKALPAGSAIVLNAFGTVEDAARYLLAIANFETTGFRVRQMIENEDECKKVYDEAAKRAHPDCGIGSNALMAKVNAARAMIRGCRNQIGGSV